MCRLSGCSSSWLYPNVRWKLVKTVAPLRSVINSSMVCMGTTSLGLIHGVGPSTISIMSRSSRRCSSRSTSLRMWNECGDVSAV